MLTSVDVDDEALAAAQRELGTTTKKDTINAALAYVAQRGQRAVQQINSAYDFWGRDVADPEIMKQARR
jgi:Arc/MetJ family transcription regulator